MGEIIKINEQQLKCLVREAIDELKYKTYKSAYDKMQGKGQSQRADDFNNTFKDIYDDKTTSFGLDRDEVWLANSEDKEKNTPSSSTLFKRDGTIMNWNPQTLRYNELQSPKRTSDRRLARNHAQKLDFYYGGESPFDRNDFIAECVDKVLSKYLK